MTSMSKRNSITGAVKKAILTCGKTRYKIAGETGVSEATLSKFIHGKIDPQLSTVDKLADALGLQITITKRKEVNDGEFDQTGRR